jgi:hypothetical protein
MGVKYEETITMRRLLIDHMLGYVQVNVYKLDFKIEWADVNDRGMTGVRGTKMMKLFMAHGIELTLIERTICMAMSPEWIMGTMLDSPEGLKIMDLPVLMLTLEGIEVANAQLI